MHLELPVSESGHKVENMFTGNQRSYSRKCHFCSRSGLTTVNKAKRNTDTKEIPNVKSKSIKNLTAIPFAAFLMVKSSIFLIVMSTHLYQND